MFCNKNNISPNDFGGMREALKSLVKEKRYAHTLGVEREAANLAKIYECGEDVANGLRAAAILHDITKEFDKKTQLSICAKYGFKLTSDDKAAEKPIHAKTAAYVAKFEFGADDLVFGAIYSHTLGGPHNAPIADKLIYIADYIEPNRAYQDCIEVREYFYSKIGLAGSLEEKYKILDETMLFSFDKTIEGLIGESLFIHKDTIKYRNSFIKEKVMV